MLYYKSQGTGHPIVILHGLFGMSDNWRTFAGLLKDQYQVLLIDLRNHGRSFWSDEFNYRLLANDVIGLLEELSIDQCSIIGHSMGGKVAINIAQLFPERVTDLIVVDIGFKKYAPGHLEIFDAMLNINPSILKSRKEAEELLSKSIASLSVRQFLLKSLSRSMEEGKNFRWKTNFRSLYKNYEHILSEVSLDQVDIRTLFVRGTKSKYIVESDYMSLRNKFNNVRIEEIEAGHWIHAERPAELFEVITAFLNRRSQ